MNDRPTPDRIFETLTGYQRANALFTALEFDLFTRIAGGTDTVPALARACETSERGMRMLADYLVVFEFLEKNADGSYRPGLEAALYLDRSSSDFQGDSARFLMSSALRNGFGALTEAVRKGGTAADEMGTIAPDHEAWVDFARGMSPRMSETAALLASLIGTEVGAVRQVLDIAAGHGQFGIHVAGQNPEARVTAVDWPAVLDVARENADAAGLADRFDVIAGDALETDLGRGYDLVLFTNFLHHFDLSTVDRMVQRAADALAPGGHIVTLEFVPEEDRVRPPRAAGFALVMLATTPAGDAYTMAEYEPIFERHGFSNRLHQLEGSMHQVIVSRS